MHSKRNITMRTLLASLLVLVPALCTPALAFGAGVPSHYVVFDIDASAKITPMYYQQVELGDAESYSLASEATRLSETLAATAWDQHGKSVDFNVPIPSFLRGEFHARGPSTSDAIDGHYLPINQRSFVLRLPLTQKRIALSTHGITQLFDLQTLAQRAEALPLAAWAKIPSEISRASTSGDPNNRLDLLIMGDGFSQASAFNTAANSFITSFFAESPYAEYASFVNATKLYTPSAEDGADHPPYLAGCSSPSCCPDIDALGDPRDGQIRNTAFDARFCTDNIQRLLSVDGNKLLAAAAANPDWNQIIVLVNDQSYGGSGGGYSVSSMHPDAADIAFHEFGHSAVNLMDEYNTPRPGFPQCSDVVVFPALPACESNVTNDTNANTIKWRDWFTPGNSIPTPTGTAGTGLFLGARFQSVGMYRSKNNCKMRNLGVPFCSVCKQAYVISLYGGGFGSFGRPVAPIRNIEPGSQLPANSATLNIASTTSFQVSLLTPTPNTLQVQWLLDGNVIAGATAASYSLNPAAVVNGTHTLTVRVRDLSTLVKPSIAGTLLDSSLTWNVLTNGNNDLLFRSGFE
jgi:hypothetical protein